MHSIHLSSSYLYVHLQVAFMFLLMVFYLCFHVYSLLLCEALGACNVFVVKLSELHVLDKRVLY